MRNHARQEYRGLFWAALAEEFLDAVRAARNGGWALGDARFKRQIAKALGRRVAPLPKGRPSEAKRNDSNQVYSDPNSPEGRVSRRSPAPVTLVRAYIAGLREFGRRI